jgi:uncharacterized protein with GYD domain
MAKYLLEVSYSLDGARGVKAEGGSARRAAAEAAIVSVGGTLDEFFFAFGSTDVYVLADFPDNVSAAALSLAVGAGGAVSIRTVVLLTPEEVDEAAGRSVNYRPPGG